MSNHIEHGHARGALYTLRQADIHEAGDYHEQQHRPDERTCAPVFVLDLTNESGDGLSLTGSRRELVEYLELVTTHVKRETDPLPALDRAVAADPCVAVTDPALGELERLVVQYAAQMTVRVRVEDSLFAALSQHFDTTGMVELTAAIAAYNMVARFLNALQITPEGEG